LFGFEWQVTNIGFANLHGTRYGLGLDIGQRWWKLDKTRPDILANDKAR
jgi:hypothetical protein